IRVGRGHLQPRRRHHVSQAGINAPWQSNPTDDEDVAWALSTAEALLGRGERQEAIRWVRKAAEQAAEAGADDRELELAKTAAELASLPDAPAPGEVHATEPSAAPVTEQAPNTMAQPGSMERVAEAGHNGVAEPVADRPPDRAAELSWSSEAAAADANGAAGTSQGGVLVGIPAVVISDPPPPPAASPDNTGAASLETGEDPPTDPDQRGDGTAQ